MQPTKPSKLGPNLNTRSSSYLGKAFKEQKMNALEQRNNMANTRNNIDGNMKRNELTNDSNQDLVNILKLKDNFSSKQIYGSVNEQEQSISAS